MQLKRKHTHSHEPFHESCFLTKEWQKKAQMPWYFAADLTLCVRASHLYFGIGIDNIAQARFSLSL